MQLAREVSSQLVVTIVGALVEESVQPEEDGHVTDPSPRTHAELGRGATFGRTAANLLIEERELEAGGLN